MEIINIYTDFKCLGGAQNIIIDLAKELRISEKSKILTTTKLPEINTYYRENSIDYKEFDFFNIMKINNDDIVISHHRKMTTMLIIMKLLFRRKYKIIHVAHNTFTTHRYLTLYPNNIVAVSKGVKNNLTSYFGISQNNIVVIYNGIKDYYLTANKSSKEDNDVIKIIVPARLEAVKRQIEIVRYTKGKLKRHVKIYFAGDGSLYDDIKKEIGDSAQYIMLGNINMMQQLSSFDYVCLFSKKEGLGMSLVEGCMYKLPLITNDLESVMEVNINGYNGYVAKGFNELIEIINNLPFPTEKTYKTYAENSRYHYEKYFKYEKMITSYKELIQKVQCSC